jgi:hypothetical protein
MLNFTLQRGDHQGDMVPTSSDPIRNPTQGGMRATYLKPGNSLYSPSGAFRLCLQLDGNAVVQCVQDSTLPRQWETGQALNPNAITWENPMWAAGTNDQGVIELDMQVDGNLVLYNATGASWNSGTEGNPGAYLRMQDDGNLVIYGTNGGALWSTNTFA